MLNLVQHLIKSRGYETLNQVQGDKNIFVQQAPQWAFLCHDGIL